MIFLFLAFWFISAAICVAKYNYGDADIYKRTAICTIFALVGPFGLLYFKINHGKRTA